MKKVIEHKKAQVLEVNDYYQYDKYEKMKMSINDLTPEKLEKGIYKKYSFLSPYRKRPHRPFSGKIPKAKRPLSKERTPMVSKSFSPQETCWGLF